MFILFLLFVWGRNCRFLEHSYFPQWTCSVSAPNAETSEEREMVRWVQMVRQAIDFLELRLADQWQPAQQLESPPTWKRGRWNEIFQRERTEGKERNCELKKLKKKKQEEFRESGFQQVLLNTALRCYCLKSHQWRYGNIKINKWMNPWKDRKSTPYTQHILFLSHSKHRNNSHPFTLTHTQLFYFSTPLSHSFVCVCVCETTGTIQDVIHCQGRAGVTGGDLRSPVRHQVMLIRRLQLQAVLDPPRSAESYTWLERVCPFFIMVTTSFSITEN